MSQQSFLDALRLALENNINQGSCLPKEPFMKLENGTAPTLNYQIEQKSGFKAYSSFSPAIPKTSFSDIAQEIPANNFFQRVSNESREAIEAMLREELEGPAEEARLLPEAVVRMHRRQRNHLQKMEQQAAAPSKESQMLQRNTMGSASPMMSNAVPSLDEIVDNVTDGRMPFSYEGMGNYGTRSQYLEEPASPNPRFFIIEEYTVASYLGDYGAGKTVKTMSLMPGEKRTITVRTYKEMTSNQTRAENVLESFSEESVEDIQNTIEAENNVNESSSTESTRASDVNVSAGGTFLGITASASAGMNTSQNASGSRESNVRGLNRAVEQHVQNSNNHREVEVNTTTETSMREEEETTIVRELENINRSRVLNFVFRQLQQQYVTLTYLSNIRVGYSNGYAESTRIVDIEQLDTLLDDLVIDTEVDNVRAELLKHYCEVINYNGVRVPFIEQKTIDYGACFGAAYEGQEQFWGKIAGNNLDEYSAGGLTIQVPGVILSAKTHTLRTDSLVADAILGQGEALDCFNTRLQNAEAVNAQLRSAEMLQKLEAIELITDPIARADAYKKVFGECCSTPQTKVIQ